MRRFYGGLAMLLALIPAATIAAPATSVVPDEPPGMIADGELRHVRRSHGQLGLQRFRRGTTHDERELQHRGVRHRWLHDPASSPIAENGSPNYNGCITPDGADFIGRTAWIRINVGVSGKVGITASTGYDGVLNLFKASETTYGQAVFANLLGSEECSSRTNGPGVESVGTSCGGAACLVLDPAYDWYVQVGGKCPPNPTPPPGNTPATCNQPEVPGGVTNIQINFIPDDTDGDGVPNSIDSCADTPAGTRVNTAGCPDADGDGIADTADQCPSAAGVTNPAPYNGCPAGPTPPFGPDPFVTVQALDGNNLNTSSVNVRLQLNWPQGAQEVVISNGDGSFGPPQRLSAPYVPWTLPPLQNQASEARQVKVIYRGPGIAPFQDSDLITLDTVKPVAPQSEFSKMADRRWHFFVKATDQGTGIRQIQMLDGRRKVLATKNFCTKSCDTAERIGLYSKKAKPVYARVTDLAGNRRVIRLDRSLARCGVPPYKVYRDNSSKSRCFAIGEECVREPWDWKNADIPLACRKVGDTFRVQHR